MTIIRVVDLETTGLAPPEAAVCEIGWTDVGKRDDAAQWEVASPHSVLVNPGHPIPPAMSAVHHITDSDVTDAPKFSEAAAALLTGGPVALCAHNARFEQQFMTTLPAQWICTYKVALHLAPHAPEHKLQTLRYWLKLDVDRRLAELPHRAGPDSYIGACLLARMLNSGKMTVAEMVELSSRPALLPKLTFGKHAMTAFAEVPTDYLDWIVSQKGMDEDVIYTARHHLKLRAA